MVDPDYPARPARPTVGSHWKALFVGIALFLVIGFGLGLMGFLVGASGDAAAPVAGGTVPVEVASVAFFALTAIILSHLIALTVGVAIGAADGRNPLVRGLMAAVASFIGFYLLVLLTIIVSGAEVTNTLQQTFNIAQDQVNVNQATWLRVFLAGLPAAGIGFLSGLLTAIMWPHHDPYRTGAYAGAAGGYGAGAAYGPEDRRALAYRAGEPYRGTEYRTEPGYTAGPPYGREPATYGREAGYTREPGYTRESVVGREEPGRYAGERGAYPGERGRYGDVSPEPYRGGTTRPAEREGVYWEPSRRRDIEENR